MEPKTWKTLSIVLGVIALLVCINAIVNKNYLLGIIGTLACIGLIIFGVKTKVEKVKIPLPVIIQNYKAFMEEHFHKSIPADINIYFNEEVMDNYTLVITHKDDENQNVYYPFEADKFSGEFGRGAGEVIHDVREIEFWINKYSKTHKAAEEISKRFSEQVAKRIREELEFKQNNPDNSEEVQNE